jgi:hypothetical protein
MKLLPGDYLMAERGCLEHDIDYEKGGSKADRLKSDKKLRRCWLDASIPRWICELSYRLIRAVGGPSWKREGVSWDYGGKFQYTEE